MRTSLLVCVLAMGISSHAQATAPIVFFNDVVSGPNSGGDSQSGFSGAYVTLYGNFFGASQGSSAVTLNGASCLRVVSWGGTWLWYQRIIVQLGSSCATGNFLVTTSGGTSNPVAFTVRSGSIFCISTTGNNSNSGAFPSSCWSTLDHAFSVMTAGATVYLLNGVSNTTTASFSAVANITGNPGGTSTNPIAAVIYPGATATIGNKSTTTYAIRVPQIGDSPAYYVIAGLTLRGGEGLEIYQADHWRIVGNDVSCETDGFGCIHVDVSTNMAVHGNWVHDIVGQVKLYHGVYYTTDTNHVDMGWNLVDPDPGDTGSAGCRGVQFYSTSGSDQFDLHVHDNIVRNTVCDGLNFNTINANAGTVEAYNNLIYHAGTHDPGEFSHYTCFYFNSGVSSPTVAALMYNNTAYDCGSRGGGSNVGAITALVPLQLRNNIIFSLSAAEPYFASDSGPCSGNSGSNNLWFGAGASPCATQLTGSVNSNPLFVNTSTKDFHIQPGSPAKDAGVTISGLLTDFDGIPRPQGSAFDIGAFEFVQPVPLGSSLSPKNTLAGPSVMK